jgi:hypothetical protein
MIMSLWALPAMAIGSMVAERLLGGGGEGGTYTPEQERMFRIQGDIADMMKGLMQQRIATEERYMPPVLQSAMQLGAQRMQPRRSTLWAPGVFEPVYRQPQGVDMQVPTAPTRPFDPYDFPITPTPEIGFGGGAGDMTGGVDAATAEGIKALNEGAMDVAGEGGPLDPEKFDPLATLPPEDIARIAEEYPPLSDEELDRIMREWGYVKGEDGQYYKPEA